MPFKLIVLLYILLTLQHPSFSFNLCSFPLLTLFSQITAYLSLTRNGDSNSEASWGKLWWHGRKEGLKEAVAVWASPSHPAPCARHGRSHIASAILGSGLNLRQAKCYVRVTWLMKFSTLLCPSPAPLPSRWGAGRLCSVSYEFHCDTLTPRYNEF